jgi:hypothetical protein
MSPPASLSGTHARARLTGTRLLSAARQVLNVEDIELVLGERPFVSDGMRNIDKYRLGFQEAEAPAAIEDEALDAEDEAVAVPVA